MREVGEGERWEKRLSNTGNGSIILLKMSVIERAGEKKNVTQCFSRKGVIEGASWMTNWGGYEMRLDSIHTLESTLPSGMYQMGSLSGAFPLIIPFQCYAPTPRRRNLMVGGKQKRNPREEVEIPVNM